MPRKIELTAEYNPTFFKGYYDGFWPHTAIFPIFAGFEGAMHSLGRADKPTDTKL